MSEQQDHLEEQDEQLEPLESLIQPDSGPQPHQETEREESPLQGESEPPESQERDYRPEAIKMGWKPIEEFKGDPSQWRDAKTFVEYGETSPAILRQRVDKLDQALERERTEAKRQQEQMQKHLEGMRRAQDYALKRQRETFMSQIEAVKQQAAQDGDPDLYRHARQQEEAARQAWETEDKQLSQAYPKAEPEQPEMPPEVKDWVSRNPWYQSDPAMAQTAIGIEQSLLAEAPGLSTAERLDQVSQRIRSIYPSKFGSQPAQPQQQANGQDRPRRQGSPVEGAQRMSGPQNSASGRFGELPGDAKQEYANAVKEGYIKDTAQERKNWAEVYLNPNIDKERAAR